MNNVKLKSLGHQNFHLLAVFASCSVLARSHLRGSEIGKCHGRGVPNSEGITCFSRSARWPHEHEGGKSAKTSNAWCS